MSQFRNYISLDIETTGIDERSHLLEISLVRDDLKSPIDDLKRIYLPIKHEIITYSEPYALGMNAELLKKMMNKDFKTYTPNEAITEIINFMITVNKEDIDEKGKNRKIIFAGKNVASFDIPKVRAFIAQHGSTSDVKLFDSLCHYKTLDVGSLYFDTFKDNVSLSEINKLTGRKEVSHNSMDDALDVVHAVRYKLQVQV